jgi:hypothetical protein
MNIHRQWVEMHVARVMLHTQVSICCITFGTGGCWRHAGTRLSKLVHFGWKLASCRCSSEIGQTHWSRLASAGSLTCRWVVGTELSTTCWISEKVFARRIPKNFTDQHKDQMGHSCKCLVRCNIHGEQFIQCIDTDETCKNHVTPKTKGTEHLWLRTTHYLPAHKVSERWNQ